MKKCTHKHTWLIASGHYEWCYECGALRNMMICEPNYYYPKTRWTRPVGINGDNPCTMKILNKSLDPY